MLYSDLASLPEFTCMMSVSGGFGQPCTIFFVLNLFLLLQLLAESVHANKVDAVGGSVVVHTCTI